MLVIGTFQHCIEVEEALAVIEHMGIERSSIMTVTMDSWEDADPMQADFGRQNKKTRAFEVGMAVATALTVVGISYGFRLVGGPIIWGLLSAGAGFGIGFGTTWLIQSRFFREKLGRKERLPELTVIIRCSESRFQQVRQVLWQYEALSVGRINEP